MYTKCEDWRKWPSSEEPPCEEVTCPGKESESEKELGQNQEARRPPLWGTWPGGQGRPQGY